MKSRCIGRSSHHLKRRAMIEEDEGDVEANSVDCNGPADEAMGDSVLEGMRRSMASSVLSWRLMRRRLERRIWAEGGWFMM